MNCCNIWFIVAVFHQALQVEKENRAEGEEDIGDSQESLWIIL